MSAAKRPCRGGGTCLPVPILAMNRGYEQKSMEPTHNLGCPACGETWEGTAAQARGAERRERGIDRSYERGERKRKDDELRARLAAAPKARPVPDEESR